jgi:hypothetical protein
MDIMDGMGTMDFPFDGRMDWFKNVTCCTCVHSVHKNVSMMSIVSLSMKKRDIFRCD